MSKDTEVDMKDVELNELDQEKLPMTGDGPGAEKNGSVKLKVPEEDVKFTGLSKEELMKVAGTPGWVRTRWVLLALFWLGWVGMLAGAIVIIVQAPRCKPIPEMNWWNQGPLYQISDLGAFNQDKGIKDSLLNQLKVKGLVLGPLHTVQKDQADTLDLVSMNPVVGTDQDLLILLEKAHKKALIGVVDGLNSSAVSQLLNSSGVDLILSDVLNNGNSGVHRAQSIYSLVSTQKQSSLAWGLGGTWGNHLASVVEKPELVRLYQLMLFTLPGTPVFNYGDEMGLVDQGSTSPKMLWDIEEEAAAEGAGNNETAESERYVTAVNWGSATLTMVLNYPDLSLPEQAKVKLSTDPENLAADSSVSLDKLLLGPGHAVLLTFPFA
ncbi:unnamed protein product [Coregonus sp. 'balchen']|nr:unnamed protein product [Coregonus sp. 'balchen']